MDSKLNGKQQSINEQIKKNEMSIHLFDARTMKLEKYF